MKLANKKISVILIALSLLTSQQSFAARFGKSRSLGMQRSIPTQSARPSYTQQPNYAQPSSPVTPQRRGPGVGAVVAGAAAGAVGGYLLGKAANQPAPSASAPTSVAATEAPLPGSSNQIPWGIIAILGMLLAIGLILFRRKTVANNALNSFNHNSAPNFEIPPLQRQTAGSAAKPELTPSITPAAANLDNQRMADGLEAQYFLRQAKGMFLHIQSMNTPENVSEVAKYLTPELYREIQQLVNNNDYVADFSELNCQLLASNVEHDQQIASVKFSGKVSESPGAPVQDFCEIWHFCKPLTDNNAKWVVAGIQQPDATLN